MEDNLCINKAAIADLVRIKEEFDSVIESLELMSNEEFMDSYQKARMQVKEREFSDWNAL